MYYYISSINNCSGTFFQCSSFSLKHIRIKLSRQLLMYITITHQILLYPLLWHFQSKLLLLIQECSYIIIQKKLFIMVYNNTQVCIFNFSILLWRIKSNNFIVWVLCTIVLCLSVLIGTISTNSYNRYTLILYQISLLS